MPTLGEIVVSLCTIKRVDHIRGPYSARPASDKVDDWPAWYVAGSDGRSNVIDGGAYLPFVTREVAAWLAQLWNAEDKHRAHP